MSNATEQARSTRSDARAFADAFAAADDAFTFGADTGSRTLTLDELGDALALERPVAAPRTRDARSPAARSSSNDSGVADDRLLTLAELGEVLARPAREADALDFDFGTSAHERARRRTAARLDASTPARRRISGPTNPSARSRRADVGLADDERRSARPATDGDAFPAARAAMAEAAAFAAERLAEPSGGTRSARGHTASPRADADRASVSLRSSSGSPADAGGRSRAELAGRGGQAAVPRLREVEPRPHAYAAVADRLRANPDRIAVWAVLLGILLVLIAFTSGSTGGVALPLVTAL